MEDNKAATTITSTNNNKSLRLCHCPWPKHWKPLAANDFRIRPQVAPTRREHRCRVVAASRLERPARRNRNGDVVVCVDSDVGDVILLFSTMCMYARYVHACIQTWVHVCVRTSVLYLVHILVLFQSLMAAFTLSVYLVNIWLIYSRRHVRACIYMATMPEKNSVTPHLIKCAKICLFFLAQNATMGYRYKVGLHSQTTTNGRNV